MHTQLQGEERAAWMQIPLRATEAGKSAASDERRPTVGEASQLRQKLGQKAKQEPKSPTQPSEPPPSDSHRSRAGWILGGSDLAEPLEVEHHFALSVGLESGDEAGSPDHLFVPIGVANVDRLEEGIVESLNQNQKLGLLPGEVFGSLAPERAGLVDGMNDRPSER